jgi:hypothetical protein
LNPSPCPHAPVATAQRRRRRPLAATGRRLRRAGAWLARRAGPAIIGVPTRIVRSPRAKPERDPEIVLEVARWRTRLSPAARRERRLAVECEAFVVGRYHYHLPRRQRWEWAWVNTLAHGNRSEIENLACALEKRAQAAAFAATEVLATGDRYGMELSWLQAGFLVPVEVECMQRGSLNAATTTSRVLAALHQARFASGSAPSSPHA